MSQTMTYVLQYAAALLLAPLFVGVVDRVKAKVGGRHGRPLLQPYLDIAKLLRKGEVVSPTTTWMFRLCPAATLGASLCALALLPMGGVPSPLAFRGDALLAAYLLGLGRFAMVTAALDTGSPFEGMGASREAVYSALAEPVLLLCALAMSSAARADGLADDLCLSGFLTRLSGAWLGDRQELALIPAVLFILLLTENCRIPVDDPDTHLELTMIHEAMILDHSGPDLAFILYAASLKLWLFAVMVTGVLVPSCDGAAGVAAGLLSVLGVAVAVGLVESVTARLRMMHVPNLLGGGAVLALLALILTQVMAR